MWVSIPELPLLKRRSFECSHDAEVVRAAFEGFPEIGMKGLRGVYYYATC